MVLRAEFVYVTALIISICQIFVFFLNLECEVEGWGKDSLRNISSYVADELTQIIPTTFCKTQFMLLIVVSSAPSNRNARQAIRETWGSQKSVLGENITLVFFIGNSLESYVQDAVLAESQQYNDIIQENFIDSYNNLTLKSLFIIKLAANKCLGNGKFLLKIDDDMFVNVSKLMQLLIERKNSEYLLLGKKMCGTHPIRDPLSKWYCPRYMYKKPLYPNFLSGTGYLMSMKTTKKLYKAAILTPLIHLEDVYITGICAENAGVVPEFNENFTVDDYPDEYCQLKDLITVHQFSPDRIRNTFNALNDPEVLEKCTNYERMFNAIKWTKKFLFMPISRLNRNMIC